MRSIQVYWQGVSCAGRSGPDDVRVKEGEGSDQTQRHRHDIGKLPEAARRRRGSAAASPWRIGAPYRCAIV